MVALAKVYPQRLSLQQLAREEQIPRKFLEHVIRSLKEGGLLQSIPGPKGGYELAEAPSLISVGRVLAAVQMPLLTPSPPLVSSSNLPEHLHEPVERLERVVNEIKSFARQRLDSVTLAELAEIDQVTDSSAVFMYYI